MAQRKKRGAARKATLKRGRAGGGDRADGCL